MSPHLSILLIVQQFTRLSFSSCLPSELRSQLILIETRDDTRGPSSHDASVNARVCWIPLCTSRMTLFQLDVALCSQPSGGTERRNIRINYVVIHPRRCSCANSNSVSASPLMLRPDCQWVAACVAGRMPLACRRVVRGVLHVSMVTLLLSL